MALDELTPPPRTPSRPWMHPDGGGLFREETRVTIQISNPKCLEESIAAMDRAIEAAPEEDRKALTDLRSILEGARRNYRLGRNCTKHPVTINEGDPEHA